MGQTAFKRRDILLQTRRRWLDDHDRKTEHSEVGHLGPLLLALEIWSAAKKLLPVSITVPNGLIYTKQTATV